jgi:hypothetical protein
MTMNDRAAIVNLPVKHQNDLTLKDLYIGRWNRTLKDLYIGRWNR